MKTLHNLGMWLENNIFGILAGIAFGLFICWTSHDHNAMCGIFY